MDEIGRKSAHVSHADTQCMVSVSYKDYCCEGQPAEKEERPDSKWVVLGELPVKEAPMAFFCLWI